MQTPARPGARQPERTLENWNQLRLNYWSNVAEAIVYAVPHFSDNKDLQALRAACQLEAIVGGLFTD